MIPSVISPVVKSTTERRIFEWFRDDPSTEDWIVLHSLGISNHNKVMHGETDFFILAPYMGLFAIEVKGGRVSRKDGNWRYTDKYGNTTQKNRGPFDQAWDGVFSIVSDIKRKIDIEHDHLKDVFFGIGVMFPDVEYDTVGCDEEQWQVFDINDGKRVGQFINRLFEGSSQRWKELYNHDVPFERLPSEEDVLYIASLLRGDFDKAVAISAQIRYSEEALINLTNEQYRCIDQLDDNKRCLILGGAGTGKTLIAVEEVKKAVAEGKKVGLFCFNRQLGEWLEWYFDNSPENLRPEYAGSFHKFMMNIVRKENAKIVFPETNYENDLFYKKTLPENAIKAIYKKHVKFDKVIIDEAQDLVQNNYLKVFDACLHGGLARGRWTMFGDFSQQAIYNKGKNGEKLIELIEDYTSFIRFKLTINCRNTKTICDEITMVTGFEPPSEIWSKTEGVPVEYMTFSTEDEQAKKLIDILQSLTDNHISPKKITILSPLKRHNSAVSLVDAVKIDNYSVKGNENISFCTIQAFKGLENSVIVLTDITSIADKKLMYVALSRARSALYILETDNARREYVELQLRRLSNG